MAGEGRRYRYVGPADVRSVALLGGTGSVIRSLSDFERWTATVSLHEMAEPFTYVVEEHGMLRLALRRSEHVACAGGGEVLAAGEVSFVHRRDGWIVTEITNQSTGYCPDEASWPAVANALERAALPHPGGFTSVFVFRRCASCQELNVVKEGDFVCAVCGVDLPDMWNVDA